MYNKYAKLQKDMIFNGFIGLMNVGGVKKTTEACRPADGALFLPAAPAELL